MTEPSAATAAALKMLRRADYFEAHIVRKLAERFEQDEVAAAVGFLKENRLLDDRRFASRLCERMSRERLWGAQRIRMELLKRGASEDVVEGVIGSLPDEALVARKLAARLKCGDASALARRLSSAGFSADTVREIVEREFA